MTLALDKIAALRERIDAIEIERDNALMRIADLEEALFRPDFRIPPEWKLTRQQATLLGALIASDAAVLTRAAMMSALYGSDDWACPKIIDVLMSKMRAKLKAHDIAVETVWGRGYRLTREARETIAATGSPSDRDVRAATAAYETGRISRVALTRRLDAGRAAAGVAA